MSFNYIIWNVIGCVTNKSERCRSYAERQAYDVTLLHVKWNHDAFR